MSIISSDTVKTLWRESGTTYDDQIEALIPIIQNWVVEFLNNHFHIDDIYISAETLACVSGSPATITDSDSGFLDAEFPASDISIHVAYTSRNDGIYNVDTVVAGTMTLSSGEELIDEDAGNGVLITLVKFPKGIQSVIADLIMWKCDKKRLCQSRSLGDFREVKLGTGGYPVALLNELNSWRKTRCIG